MKCGLRTSSRLLTSTTVTVLVIMSISSHMIMRSDFVRLVCGDMIFMFAKVKNVLATSYEG